MIWFSNFSTYTNPVTRLITATIRSIINIKRRQKLGRCSAVSPLGPNSLFKTRLRELMPDVIYRFYKCYWIKNGFYSNLCIFVRKNTENSVDCMYVFFLWVSRNEKKRLHGPYVTFRLIMTIFPLLYTKAPFSTHLTCFLDSERFYAVSLSCSCSGWWKTLITTPETPFWTYCLKKTGFSGSFWGVPGCPNVSKIPQKQQKMPKKCQKLHIFEPVSSQKPYFSRCWQTVKTR